MAETFVVQDTLTSYARGLMQDLDKNSLANFIAPKVPTGIASGQFKEFSDKNAFMVPKTGRAIGGKANRIAFETEDRYFNCKPNALEITIDEHERRLAGEKIINLERAKIATVVTQAKLSREKSVWDLVMANIPAVSDVGEWTNENVDPIKQLDAQLVGIAEDTGMVPNRMVVGLSAFCTLRNNAILLEELKGSGFTRLTLARLADMLIFPGIDIRLGVVSYEKAKRGKSGGKDFVIGSEVLIFIGSDNPTVYDPSFAKTFATDGSNIDSVRSYQEDPRTDVYAVDWTEDTRVVSSIAARRISIT